VKQLIRALTRDSGNQDKIIEITEVWNCLSLVITKASITLSALQTAYDTDIWLQKFCRFFFFGVNRVALF
jgi:hypothetical protein